MKLLHTSCLLIAFCSAPLLRSAPATEATESVGQFAHHGDIGQPDIPGSFVYDESVQEYRLAGSGINIWSTSDQFHYAWNSLKGDFIVRARLAMIGQGVDPHRKLGWMVRSSLDSDAAYVDACVHGDGLDSMQFRRTKGATTEQHELTIRGGDVIQLERKGSTYIFSAAHYGEPFVSTTLSDINLGDDVQVGLFVCAHHAKTKEEVIFRDVRVIRPPKPGYVPYRDYIGAQLQILNVYTSQLSVVYTSLEQFEAPNWLHDGHTLLLNISGPGPNKGLLKTFDLATGQMAAFDTGAAIHNNNDHVVSFDGKMLGISNHSAEDGNHSVVFKLPITGGKPERVTKNSPSYGHGWSPDGRSIVFTGGRKEKADAPDKYDIYKISADGGEETRLTTAPGLNDGPEYTPDGKYVYFNSTRTGLMQIWRMKPDGTDQEQVTNDEYNNWFPHVSPDGKWIAFISFGQDVKSDDHPYYKHVYVRLLPISGGTPKVIAYAFGGQGTINVPSWSPDSTRIAFVSNTQLGTP